MLLHNPKPSEAMDSVINDRRSIKWPCYAVNLLRNGLHSHSKRDLWHEVILEKNLEQPNIDSFSWRLFILKPKLAILAQFHKANLFKLTKAFNPFFKPSFSISSKILRWASSFQLSSPCLDIPMNQCLSCLIYYIQSVNCCSQYSLS